MTMRIKGNVQKYLSYKLAFGRLTGALKAGFPLEAIVIAESILADRLLSFANHHGEGLAVEKTTLGQVARKVVRLCKTAHNSEGQALAERAVKWMNKRNQVVHSIAKSEHGTGPKLSADKFVENALSIAIEGRELVNEIKKWHQRELRRFAIASTPTTSATCTITGKSHASGHRPNRPRVT